MCCPTLGPRLVSVRAPAFGVKVYPKVYLPGEISSELGRVEQRWIVDLLIADHCVHALSGNFIISELDISILALIIDGLETAVIF